MQYSNIITILYNIGSYILSIKFLSEINFENIILTSTNILDVNVTENIFISYRYINQTYVTYKIFNTTIT